MISVRLIVLFYVSLQRAVSSKRLTGQLISIDYIPVESAKLYDVQTTTEHHCINRCIQDRLCLSALYNRTGSSCSGYSRRSVSTTKLAEGLKAWHVMYEGKSATLQMSLDQMQICRLNKLFLFSKLYIFTRHKGITYDISCSVVYITTSDDKHPLRQTYTHTPTDNNEISSMMVLYISC